MEKLVRKIGLVAHDAMKKDLIEWVLWNSELLMGHKFYCTGTTGTLILEALREKHPDVEWDFTILKSGPLGGDQQMGSRIVDGALPVWRTSCSAATAVRQTISFPARCLSTRRMNALFPITATTPSGLQISRWWPKRWNRQRSGNGKNKDETRFYWAFLIYRYPSFMDSPHWCDSPPLPFEVIELHNNGVGESAHSMSLRYW